MEDHAPEEQRVLNFFGVGGIGKSRLQQELRGMLRQRANVVTARLDFQPAGYRRHDQALYQLRHQLQRDWGLSFPAFDIAYVVYWQRMNPGVPLTARELPLIGESEILSDLVGVVAGAPLMGAVVSLMRVIDGLGRKTARWSRVRTNDDLQRLDELDAHDVLNALSFFFAQDLRVALTTAGARGVIFLDAHEALWEDAATRGLRGDRDSWIRDLIVHTPGVLWVISSRDALRWDRHSTEWKEPYLRHFAVADLSPADSIEFLLACGVPELEADAIARAACGVPFYLNLAVDHYDKVAQDRRPHVADFEGSQDELISRFIGHLRREEGELLRLLSASSAWDRCQLEFLTRRFNVPLADTYFDELCAYSFTREVRGGRWVMHGLMREALYSGIPPGFRKELHQSLFRYEDEGFSDRGRPIWERAGAFPAASSHALSAGELDPEWFAQRGVVLMNQGLWAPVMEAAGDLRQQTLDAVPPAVVSQCDFFGAWALRLQGRLAESVRCFEGLELTSLAPLDRLVRFQHANARRESGFLAEARDVYERLWRDVEPVPLESLESLDLLIGIQYADALYVAGAFRDAQAILQPIRQLDQATHLKEVAEATRILGHIARFSEKSDRGLSLYREAAEHFAAIEDPFGEAVIATNLVEALWPLEPDEAIRRSKEAIERNEKLGVRLEVGKVLVARGLAHLRLGDVRSAEADLREARETQIEVGYQFGEAAARLALGIVLVRAGDAIGAQQEIERALLTFSSLGGYPTLQWVALTALERLGVPVTQRGLTSQSVLNAIQWLDDRDAGSARIAARFLELTGN